MLELIPFRYALRAPIVTASTTIEAREGFVLKLHHPSGAIMGECAPLPSFSQESLDACGDQAARWQHRLAVDGRGPDLARWVDEARALPALQCAVETLIARAIEADAGRLGDERWPAPAHTRVQAHALVSSVDDARAAVQEGFQTLKIKVGAGAILDDARRVRAIRRAVGDTIRLRLDANQAWSNDDARTALDAFQTERIEFIEEPLRAPTPDNLLALKNYSAIPIAADESARTEHDIQRIIEHACVDAIVLKPTLCGGPLTTQMLAQKCHAAKLLSVVTTSFDGPIGTQMTIDLCGRLPGIPRAHGIATGRLFADASSFADHSRGAFHVRMQSDEPVRGRV